MSLVSLAQRHQDLPVPPDKARRSAIVAIDDVSLDIEAGDVYGIIGYSGAGKSTLVRLINALEPVTTAA